MEAYLALLIVTIIQRLFELRLSAENKLLLVKKGAYEIGQRNYFWMRIMHVSFFVAIFTELYINSFEIIPLNENATLNFGLVFLLILLFTTGQTLRYLSQRTLGQRWTTEVLIWPAHPSINTGIFKYFKHPNYFGVILEFIAIPLMAGLWKTTLIYSLLNLFILHFRIAIENNALKTMNGHIINVANCRYRNQCFNCSTFI